MPLSGKHRPFIWTWLRQIISGSSCFFSYGISGIWLDGAGGQWSECGKCTITFSVESVEQPVWCMHIVSTVLVVVLSIVSLVIIIIAAIKDKSCRSYGICAGIALGMMLVGALGMNMVPKAYFGVVERFSVFAATGFNAVLGIHLYLMDSKR